MLRYRLTLENKNHDQTPTPSSSHLWQNMLVQHHSLLVWCCIHCQWCCWMVNGAIDVSAQLYRMPVVLNVFGQHRRLRLSSLHCSVAEVFRLGMQCPPSHFKFVIAPQILKPAEKKQKFMYSGIASARPGTPPRGFRQQAAHS